MRSYKRVFGLALIAAGLCVAPRRAGQCSLSRILRHRRRVRPRDGRHPRAGRSGHAITEYKAQKRLGAVSVSAMRAKPQPYWRDSVSANLFYKPDIVKSNSYTVCWSRRGLALCLHFGRQSLLVI